ncbi:MAG: hypothetical protein DHS20C17_25810 [Cyclobacteriaceae bacterium]|nr:MAG: hypothetical protein DHS20C17_25810 [Cyclobacteriaceae bacterium]
MKTSNPISLNCISLLLAGLLLVICRCAEIPDDDAEEIPAQLIWDQAEHSAFTDLVFFQGQFYCTFREGVGHTPAKSNVDGAIRVINSVDGEQWKSAGLITVENYDLRDPKLSVTPDGRLMVLMGAADYQGKEVMGRQGMVSFSQEGLSFSEPVPIRMDSLISNDKDWLWRVNWHQPTGYGVMYQNDGDASKAYLVQTSNGIDYQLVTDLGLDNKPNEATIKILPNQQMTMIIRREGGNTHGLMGKSMPPYQQWEWQDLGIRLGGPDFLLLPDGEVLLGSRVYGEQGHRTGLFLGQQDGHFKQVGLFPSGGDTSYPGMVMKNDTVYVSYYSGHENKTSIYFAVVPLGQIIMD